MIKRKPPTPPRRRANYADIPPHSWCVSQWTQHAPHVFPNTSEAAHYVVRFHRAELIAAGALVRVGRRLCVLGGPYASWLIKKAKLVTEYTVPMNALEHAHTRGGRDGTATAITARTDGT